VSIRRGDSGDVVAAAMNAPVVIGDSLLTSSSSRAEVQFDYSNMVRIASNSEVRFADLRPRHYQVQIAIGTVTFTNLRSANAETELDTPAVGVRPLGRGAYRITVREDGSTDITVRFGEADILSQKGSERLRAGSTMMVRGTAADPEFQIVAAIGLDDWDKWNANRDQELERSQQQAYQHVSPEINGGEDLNQNGRWVQDPSYGSVWAPNEPPGWAPYQNGRWVWEDWYGWTWVSYDPWGWAPYHYGRWFYGPVGWCWYPGPVYAHPYWSPALVGFFGFGGHVGFGFGFANVGWVALAPFEAFHPWWGAGYRGGFANARIVNNVNIVNTYRNARVNNGVMSVGAGEFGRRAGGYTGLSGARIGEAGVLHGGMPVAPERSSLQMTDRGVRAGAYPQTRNQQFFGRTSTAAAQRVSFEQQRQAVQQSAQRFSSGAATSNAAGWRSTGAPGGQAGGAEAGHAWQRFGEPVHGNSSTPQSSYRGQTGQASSTGGGWQRFGSPGAARPYGGSTNEAGRGYQGGGASNNAGGSNRGGSYSAPRGNYESSGSHYAAPPSSGERAPVRISPSLVQRNNSGGGSSGRSYSAPARSTGGGGGGHPSGGGGGHSGGGGHGHSR
jgi:hypothetical protein